MFLKKKQQGFTLIELLVSIGIIGLLLAAANITFTNSRLKSRDSKRMSDMRQIMNALELYLNDNNSYPVPHDGINNFENSTGLYFLDDLIGPRWMLQVPVDPVNTTVNGLKYYYYGYFDPTFIGCPADKGNIYILGVTDIETLSDGEPHPARPGCDCPGSTWIETFDNALDWYVCGYESD